MDNERPKVVVTDCDHPSLEPERRALEEIDPVAEAVLSVLKGELPKAIVNPQVVKKKIH